MSINCLMNSSQFSSDEMMRQLNERALGLEPSSIVKEASGNIEVDPYNGINLMPQ